MNLVEWVFVFVAVFAAALALIRLLDRPGRNNVREISHQCWPSCCHAEHYHSAAVTEYADFTGATFDRKPVWTDITEDVR